MAPLGRSSTGQQGFQKISEGIPVLELVGQAAIERLCFRQSLDGAILAFRGSQQVVTAAVESRIPAFAATSTSAGHDHAYFDIGLAQERYSRYTEMGINAVQPQKSFLDGMP